MPQDLKQGFLSKVMSLLAAGHRVAIATVLSTWGSSPRPAGSQMAVTENGHMTGSVSGGCVEAAVVTAAQNSLKTGECEVLEFGVSDDEAFAAGLTCGGSIRVSVEPVGTGNGPDAAFIAAMAQQDRERRPFIVALDLKTRSRRLICGQALEHDPYRSLVLSGKPHIENTTYYGVFTPPLALYIIGGVHIAQALTQMAALAGYDVRLIDPRTQFANAERFPGVTLMTVWPDEALAALPLDNSTALVTLSHDPKLDDPAIEAALRKNPFYIACLGSKKTHAKRLNRLLEQGFSRADTARIHGPAGLDIGSSTPGEIAVSIMAEMTRVLRSNIPNTGKDTGENTGKKEGAK